MDFFKHRVAYGACVFAAASLPATPATSYYGRAKLGQSLNHNGAPRLACSPALRHDFSAFLSWGAQSCTRYGTSK